MLRVTYVNIVQFTPRRYTLHERSVVIVQYMIQTSENEECVAATVPPYGIMSSDLRPWMRVILAANRGTCVS